MTDFDLLKEKIRDSGMTMVAISKKSGILRETLYNRLKGVGDFTAVEMMALSETLGLTNEEKEAIFFAKKVEYNATA